jgi:hypothetical protein
MKQYEINQFFSSTESLTQIAHKIREAVLATGGEAPLANIVYANVPGEPLSFYADVLHTRHIVRLEYAKCLVNGREFASAQYVDITVVGRDEVRGNTLVRMITPNHVLLPDGESLEFPLGTDNNYHVGRVRAAISQALLGSVIEGLPNWTYGS